MAEPSFDVAAAHRWFGVELNNGTWDALASGSVTAESGRVLPARPLPTRKTASSSSSGFPAATGTGCLQDSALPVDFA